MGQFVQGELLSRSQARRWRRNGLWKPACQSGLGALDDWSHRLHSAKSVSVHTNLTLFAAIRSRLTLMYASPLDFVTHADINDNVIRDCGLLDFKIDEDTSGKNGEGICEYYDCDAS